MYKNIVYRYKFTVIIELEEVVVEKATEEGVVVAVSLLIV